LQQPSRWYATLLAVSLFLLLAGVPLPAEEPAAPAFAAGSTDGATVSGPLEELAADWSVRLGGTKPARVKGGELLSLTRLGRPLPGFDLSEQHLVFVNGDRVRGTVLRLDGEKIVFRLPPEIGDGKSVSVPLSALAVIWLRPPEDAGEPDRLLRQLAGGQRTRDSVRLHNGDVVEGILTALDDKSVRLEGDKKQEQVPRPNVAAIALSSELASDLRPKGTFGRVVLANGSRLSLAKATSDGNTLTATTLFDAKVEVPLSEVRALDLFGGRAVYLSDLKPKRYDFTPFLDRQWPWVRDGSVAGRDMVLAGRTYTKGIGLHSESRLTYDLGGGYQRFEALVGIDDRTGRENGREGSVRIGVLVDGKAQDVGGDKELTPRSGPRVVKVNVAGARELTLVVEFGRGEDVLDHVDWANARLVK
jgi:hypothetical protein